MNALSTCINGKSDTTIEALNSFFEVLQEAQQMQGFAIRSHGGHTYNQTAAQAGIHHEDPRYV